MKDLRLSNLFSCIDNTTLGGTDSEESVKEFCNKTLQMQLENGEYVASVCVFPKHVVAAKKILLDTPIKVASVAGGFPAGQLPRSLKMEEIRYVVGEGADEVDFVINRGDFITGNYNLVSDEIASAKEICGSCTLKVILETGELCSAENIFKASMLAMESGADFIKTSTGKIATGATVEATECMLEAILEFHKIHKKIVGFKAAGGIQNVAQALSFYSLAEKIYGEKSINKQNFRIGTSRLTQQLFKDLTF